ncbi:MAG: hypothetical protein M0Q95_05150 [Porticoccaceae bacterium]|nr:hypothetical protein [Porticoccaceae bacterium]
MKKAVARYFPGKGKNKTGKIIRWLENWSAILAQTAHNAENLKTVMDLDSERKWLTRA